MANERLTDERLAEIALAMADRDPAKKLVTVHGSPTLGEINSAFCELQFHRAAAGREDAMHHALILVRGIIKDAAMTGFDCHNGDWAERLFESQAVTLTALKKGQS